MEEEDFKLLARSFFQTISTAISLKTGDNFTYDSPIPVICQICHIDVVKGDMVRNLECKHIFHASCICKYVDRVNQHCPYTTSDGVRCNCLVKPWFEKKEVKSTIEKMFEAIPPECLNLEDSTRKQSDKGPS
jgi:hypothetical protein